MSKKSKRVNKNRGINKRRGTMNKTKRTMNKTKRTIKCSMCKKSIKNQVPFVMIGCSKKNKHTKTSCPNCGENCYLNRRIKKHNGGSGCGSGGCPISPLSWNKMNKFGGGCASCGQNGGNCDSCGQNGGGTLAPAPVPGPSTGQPWGPQTNEWPGMDGISGGRNYLSQVNVVANPQQQMSMNGSGYVGKPNSMVGGNKKLKKDGYKKGGYKKDGYKKGGGFLPQDFVNLGRESIFNFKGMYNAMNGYKAPIDPSPYKGQLTGNNRIMI